MLALQTIITQGEGSSSERPASDDSHYQIFLDWKNKGIPGIPTQIVRNPATKRYEDSSIVQVS